MKLLQSQRGMGFLSWIICISLAGFMVLLLMRLLPIYIEDYNIKSSLKALQEDPSVSISNISVPMEIALRNNLMKHFLINSISSAGVNNITVKKLANGMQVEVIYDAKAHIAGNVDVVCHFDESIVVHPK